MLTFYAVLAVVVAVTPGEACWKDTPGGCIRGKNNAVFSNVRNLWACKAKCEEATSFVCRSVDYNPSTKACHLSTYWSRTAGSDFTAPCYMSGWDYSERFCWNDVPGACIRGLNAAVRSNVASIGECKALCETTTSFVCRSVDYNPSSNTCHLSKYWSGSVPSAFTSPCYLRGWDYSEQACWKDTPRACIRGRNNAIVSNVPNLWACKEKCEQAKGFVCRSVDYNPSAKACHLSSYWSASAGSDFTSPCYLSGWHFSERI